MDSPNNGNGFKLDEEKIIRMLFVEASGFKRFTKEQREDLVFDTMYEYSLYISKGTFSFPNERALINWLKIKMRYLWYDYMRKYGPRRRNGWERPVREFQDIFMIDFLHPSYEMEDGMANRILKECIDDMEQDRKNYSQNYKQLCYFYKVRKPKYGEKVVCESRISQIRTRLKPEIRKKFFEVTNYLKKNFNIEVKF